jgi:hypothetical protein
MKKIWTAQEIHQEFYTEHAEIMPWSTFELISVLGTKEKKEEEQTYGYIGGGKTVPCKFTKEELIKIVPESKKEFEDVELGDGYYISGGESFPNVLRRVN